MPDPLRRGISLCALLSLSLLSPLPGDGAAPATPNRALRAGASEAPKHVLRARSSVASAGCGRSAACALPKAGRLRFIVYGDDRDGHEIHRQIVDLILKEKPALVLQTGDLVRNGDNIDQWHTYDAIVAPLRRGRIPIYPARGNHENHGGEFDRRVPDGIGPNKLYYAFDRAGCHFIALAVDESMPYGPGSPQHRWLEDDLASAAKRAAHIFIFFHVPPYSIGAHGSDMAVRAALCPLFERYHVCVVFNGHDHDYYHTLRNGVHYFVTGGGGAPLYAVHPAEKGAIEGDTYEMSHHLLICDVDGERIRFMPRHPDDTPLRGPDGRSFDFEIRSPPPSLASG